MKQPVIKQGVDLPPKRCRGRPKGRGCNIILLRSLKPGDTVWDVGRKKMLSIVATGQRFNIKLMVRRIPETNKYAFKVIHEVQTGEDSG